MIKTFTYNDIINWQPCYNPIQYIPENWEGTAIDILKMKNVPFEDRLWCVLRTELISERVMRLFAVWCYRQTLKFITNPDPRSIECANIAERFALGAATQDELSAAESAAWPSAQSAMSVVWSAESAAWSAAESVESAAWSAAESARASAWSARAAALSSVEPVEWSVAWSAMSAAWLAESAQRDKLIEMILEEEKV